MRPMPSGNHKYVAWKGGVYNQKDLDRYKPRAAVAKVP